MILGEIETEGREKDYKDIYLDEKIENFNDVWM